MEFNTLRPRQDGRHFADDIFRCILFNENGCILIRLSLKYVRKGSIDNSPALVQIMVWRRSSDKPLSEPMVIISPTDIGVTRPQWVKIYSFSDFQSLNEREPFICSPPPPKKKKKCSSLIFPFEIYILTCNIFIITTQLWMDVVIKIAPGVST